MPSQASDLSWHPSLQFRMADSVFKRLFGVRPDPPGRISRCASRTVSRTPPRSRSSTGTE